MNANDYEIGQKLSIEDVNKLLENPSEEVRAHTAEKIAKSFTHDMLSEGEKELAEAIFRIMLNDTALEVRKVLSENLKSSTEIPHDVAVQMASDVDEVAIPVISLSKVLTDDDLINIIKKNGENKQIAVASRESVSENVTNIIAKIGAEKAVAAMVGNQGAKINEDSLNVVVDRFKDSEIVKRPLALREKLPLIVAERLISMVSDELKHHLKVTYSISDTDADKIAVKSREKATVSIAYMSTDREVKGLIDQLFSESKLTPSIIFRSLCTGDLKFFEHSMSKLTSLPVHNVRVLIYDSGDLGLKGLFDKARLPPILYPAMKAAVEVFLETQIVDIDNGLAKFKRKVAERVLTKLDDSGIEIQDADLEYIMEKINTFPASYAELF